MDEIKIYRSKRNGIKILGGSLVFVILGIDIITSDPEHQLTGWLSVCFFGLLIPISIFQIFNRRPAIIINEEGLMLKIGKKTFVEWQYMDEAVIKNTTRWTKVICLYTKEGYSPHADRNAFWKIMYYWSKNLGNGDVTIPVSNISTDPVRLLNLITTLINTKTMDRRALIAELAQEGTI